MGRKCGGKRRNCSLGAISPIPAVFLKSPVQQTSKNQGLFGKGLNPIQVTDFLISHTTVFFLDIPNSYKQTDGDIML